MSSNAHLPSPENLPPAIHISAVEHLHLSYGTNAQTNSATSQRDSSTVIAPQKLSSPGRWRSTGLDTGSPSSRGDVGNYSLRIPILAS